jgi:Flp pilus assembly protein TadD
VGPVSARTRAAAGVVGIACAVALAGCAAYDKAPPDAIQVAPPVTANSGRGDPPVQYYASDPPLRQAVEHFNRGDFGIAEHYFQEAVEKAPKDASAWIGLAASYDHLGRFDLADQAYGQAIRLVGKTPAILNNLGYSYMLRGDFARARKYLLKAYAREPDNPFIVNNLRLLDGSKRFIERPPDAR